MESVEKEKAAPVWFNPYASIRADVYVMLASLLVGPPSEDNLNVLQHMEWDEDISEKMHEALLALRRASRDYQPAVVREEYNRLFVGLGMRRGHSICVLVQGKSDSIAAAGNAALRPLPSGHCEAGGQS